METLNKIIALEWDMFQKVENEGGRGPCQDDAQTFRIMRESQFSAWPETVLQGYQADLERAQADGRNLVMEKYARMMERTAPERYAQISPFLPPLGSAETAAINEIMHIQQKWIRAFASRYPHIAGHGRSHSAAEDREYAASSETYLRSELATYSLDTLLLLLEFLVGMDRAGQNITQQMLERTVKEYGFLSLEDAESRYAQASE